MLNLQVLKPKTINLIPLCQTHTVMYRMILTLLSLIMTVSLLPAHRLADWSHQPTIEITGNNLSKTQISAPFSTPILLSFDLLNFDARYTRDGNLLTWELEQVDEIANFEVHYSADAMTFEMLSEQEVVGTQYNYLDPNYRTGRIAYYQLMAIMKDGSVEYSEIKAVELPQKQHTLTLLPSPTSSHLQVIFEMAQANPLQILILNANGQIVAQYTEQGVAGVQKIVLDVSELPSGMYNLMLHEGIKSRTRRFLKE